ncbi:toll-Interleukin receptor [Nocardia salmonicida]|uniref:toll-Interleukin receptor n=1 Tax=Nocardia salmonicida TaxID=53431 RepID=UPI0033D21817
MATYLKASDLRVRAGAITASAAGVLLRKASAEPVRQYDIFLSHSFKDALAILGLRELLMEQGLSVYVDWLDDPQLDRSQVSEGTANMLRYRMNNSKTLVFATSRASGASKWMPWELGYFDGGKGSSNVAICPIETESSGDFAGQEYLGLYKTVEMVKQASGITVPSVVTSSRNRAEGLKSFGQRQGQYYQVS